jgi:hypothetical protein
MKYISNVRTVRCATVHVAVCYGEAGRWIPLCGSGQTTMLSRRKQSSYVASQNAVSCKKCRERLAGTEHPDGYLSISPVSEPGKDNR